MSDQQVKSIIEGARSDAKADLCPLIDQLFPDFFACHGDRVAADDPAIIAGFATIEQHAVAVVATNKGRELKERLSTHFGSPTPQGYRKALRMMQTAERLGVPIISLINTPGAYPGEEAEISGQGQVLAQSISSMLQLKTPILTIIIGEAGSGGALALACADQVWMLEHSMYTVLSPEGFASIMWKDSKLAAQAAQMMHIEPEWLQQQQIIEKLLPEKILDNQAHDLQQLIVQQLTEFDQISLDELLVKRQARFRKF
ncbi:acetyl-CoA carboxylase carboxyl transferase subunit alpha [Bombilactobacillus folatiphilus]|uniref:acetyl-CoA carboxytransferase n=1 Tax=Bombilactobacillus folatiphilus TaxID=2923362 RepID=A0ABY4P8L4_9LACO|nr:carboxyl transferase domain-containing protein [Bombilactobacillus folatiphilus]UQS82048.1 acetyl-CoA carboxylase carboxyl transferase subunit alpha [Bombilactobacillus folatiphilus]